MTGLALVATLIVSLGILQPEVVSAWAQHGNDAGRHPAIAHEGHAYGQHGQHGAMQHGDMSDPEAHFRAVAERLALTAGQREVLAEPFTEAFAAMQRLHELHAAIAAELTDEQKATLATMMHEMMGHALEGEGGAR
jgi:hypothetical protein